MINAFFTPLAEPSRAAARSCPRPSSSPPFLVKMPGKRSPLETTLGGILERRASLGRLRGLSPPNAPDAVDFSSNDYLSLSSSSEIHRAFVGRLRQDRGRLGSGGSRLLDGNSSLAERLERKIARFHGAEAALLFTSAFDANVGLLACVPQPGDIILYDELIHASVHDGMRLSRAGKTVPFSHASVVAKPAAASLDTGMSDPDGGAAGSGSASLDATLRTLTAGDGGARVKQGRTSVFICVEGIYSMDGDVLSLATLVATLDRHLPARNCYVIVDEAHSVGVVGPRGRGVVADAGPELQARVWARVLGFGKAMGCTGGAVLCSDVARRYLINYARTLIYTTAMGDPALAALDAVYDFIVDGGAEARRRRLRGLVRLAHRTLLSLARDRDSRRSWIRVGAGLPTSPIIPVLTPQARSLAAHCQRAGFIVRPIVAPTVPYGKERVRVCLHAGNTARDVLGLGTAIELWIQRQEQMSGVPTAVATTRARL